uniref:hypothetical protein n=1 Tax=Herbiconiux sp. TaxID=1871186 RepID=UPI0025C6AE55
MSRTENPPTVIIVEPAAEADGTPGGEGRSTGATAPDDVATAAKNLGRAVGRAAGRTAGRAARGTR